MATKKPTPKPARTFPVGDSKGRIRIYADIPKEVAKELAILALRADKPKKDLLADIIIAAVKAA